MHTLKTHFIRGGNIQKEYSKVIKSFHHGAFTFCTLTHYLLIRLVVVFLMLAIILLVVFLLIVFLLVLILLILSSLMLLLLLLLTVVFLIFGGFWLGDVVIFAASARRHWDVHLGCIQ